MHVVQALAAANQYIVTNISKASSGGEAARCSSAPAPAARRQSVASPFAKASAAAAMQRSESAKAEPPAHHGGNEGAACSLRAARSGSGAGVAGSTSPPRVECLADPLTNASGSMASPADAAPAPPVAAVGRPVNTAEVCCSSIRWCGDTLWVEPL